jgi:hypothetical protein
VSDKETGIVDEYVEFELGVDKMGVLVVLSRFTFVLVAEKTHSSVIGDTYLA